MSKLLEKIFSSGAKEVVDSIGNAVDSMSTSNEEKQQKKNELTDIVVNALNKSLELQKEVLSLELTGNWLQRSWRPILMLAFGFIIVYRYFLSPVFGFPSIDMPEKFWDLLQLGIGGYVIGRSLEKISETTTKNVDLSFLRRRDRKAAKDEAEL